MDARETKTARLRDEVRSGRIFLAVFCFWTISVGISLLGNITQDYRGMREVALAEARSHFKKDMAFRRWISSHGGVYVPVNARTAPDPHMASVRDRDIEIPGGNTLTLIHPMDAARQINGYFRGPFDVTSRTVTLRAAHPENRPGPWEERSLEAFEKGETEASLFTEVDGQPVLRLLRPAHADEDCLACHRSEGYRVGDILGVVGINVPLAPRIAMMHQHMYREIAAHLALWLVGLFGIVFGQRRFRSWLRFRKKAEGQLREREALFRGLSEQSPNMIFISLYGTIVYANETFVNVMACTPEDVSDHRVEIKNLLPGESYEKASELFERRLRGETVAPFESTLVNVRGEEVEVIIAITPLPYKGKRAILGTITDITARKEMEAKISASLHEKDVLLQEIHHRVKNNLQVISSLLSLQADSVASPDILEIFRESERRIRSMAAVHEQLYRSGNLAFIDSAVYIHSVVEDVYGSYSSSAHVELRTELESIDFSLDTAIPCGLIINELLSNALKYGFPDGRAGRVTVALRHGDAGRPRGEGCELSVCDNGVGLPETLDVHNTETLGLQLVTSLSERQLGGTLDIVRAEGASFYLRFDAR